MTGVTSVFIDCVQSILSEGAVHDERQAEVRRRDQNIRLQNLQLCTVPVAGLEKKKLLDRDSCIAGLDKQTVFSLSFKQPTN